MGISQNSQNNLLLPILVAADQDRFGEHRGLGVSTITFKVMPKDSQDVFIIETRSMRRVDLHGICITNRMNGSTL